MSIAAVSSSSIFQELQSLNQSHQTDVKQLDKVLRKGGSGDPFGPPVAEGGPLPARFIGPPIAPPWGPAPEPPHVVGPPIAEQAAVKLQSDYALVLNLFNSASTDQSQTNSNNALSVNA